MKGKVYWITGLSGAGKTTIGNALYYDLKKKMDNLVLLDGDILKKLLGKDLKYSEEERLERARRYSDLCKVLSDQGINIIICTIAMFEEIRKWNRANIDNYIEIFLKVDMNILMKRDRKGLYSTYKSSGNAQLVGVDQKVEFPQNPDLIINNNGELSIKECIGLIKNLEVKSSKNYDIAYWNNYYANKQSQIIKPSLFAECCVKHMEKGKSLLDLGCGNGRDSVFFIESGLIVTGIDTSEEAIRNLQKIYEKDNHLFICDDFTTADAVYQKQYDYCYSRFTLHAISDSQEKRLLDNVYTTLCKGGKFLIEARSVNDEIYGKGKKVGEHEFIYNNHYRRFLVMQELLQRLEKKGFTIIYANESDEFAPLGDSKPTLIRVTAVKNDSSLV
ncbi:MAG: adenylyl-sulfate kinase [Lachnospiraceae bacterium]|nr:adenylyl-sulfate kinase [Lachnospiraceae bacterium]